MLVIDDQPPAVILKEAGRLVDKLLRDYDPQCPSGNGAGPRYLDDLIDITMPQDDRHLRRCPLPNMFGDGNLHFSFIYR